MQNIYATSIFINSVINNSEFFILNSTFYAIHSSESGGCIHLRNVQTCTMKNTLFERCTSELHGGAVMLNKTQKISIDSCSFKDCSSSFGGAISFILDPIINTNIRITNSSEFVNNSASVGSAMFLSVYEPKIITEIETFNIFANQTIINRSLNIINVENNLFITQTIFIALLPSFKQNFNDLHWKTTYQWNNTNVEILNDFEPFTTQIDNATYITPFLIPLKLQDRSTWKISNEMNWMVKLDFVDFWNSLLNPTNLSFNCFLFAYQNAKQHDINIQTQNSLSMELTAAVFENNYANILSTLYFNVPSYQYTNISIHNVNFIRNIAASFTSVVIDVYGNNEINTYVGTSHISCDECNFESNVAYSSGTCFAMFGVGSSSSTLSCNDCVFSSNFANTMAAVAYIKNSTFILNKSQIKENNSSLGSNILIDGSKFLLYHSIFAGNVAMRGGGSAITINNIHQLIMNEFNLIDIDNFITDLVDIDNCTFLNHFGNGSGTISIPITDSTFLPTMTSVSNRRGLQQNNTGNSTDTPLIVETYDTHSCTDLQLEILIDPDVHFEDVSWSIKLNDVTVNESSMYACIIGIVPDIGCITFTIYDTFGDGLNYGEGNYIIKWKSEWWESQSLGNYGESESLTVCPGINQKTEYLTIFVALSDEQSLSFLEFLEDELIPLLDWSINYKVVVDIKKQSESGTDNETCVDCSYGYCLCDALSNVTMDNVIAALCYSSVPSFRSIYNFTWEDIWSDEMQFDSYCAADVQSLLDENYRNLSMFDSYNTPSFYIGAQST
eukprot:61273_1